MRRKRLLWQLYPSYLLITLVSLLAITLYSSRVIRRFHLEQTMTDLESRAHLIQEDIRERLVAGQPDRTDLLCKELGDKSSTRITVILPDGKVTGDTEKPPAEMDNHAGRPEIIEAMAGGTGSSVRFSHTLGQDVAYVAISVEDGDKIVGVVRTSIPLAAINRAMTDIYLRIAAGGLIVALLVAVVSMFVSRRISRPLEEIKRGAERFARGDLGHKLATTNCWEIAALAETLNRMVAQIEKLENVRRDFVANVSHELRTPITSIKGYVETLLDGAMHSPDDAQRFLQIITIQTNRLGAIIDDLLALSRIEQKAGNAEILLQRGRIKHVLEAAIDASQSKFLESNIQIECFCGQELEALINAPLLEQAVANLIDNACKYSPPGATVQIEASRTETEVIIRVKDHGCGIDQQHLPRIFERFYRVDKARSRKLGGTGLGLAIVKHIAEAHAGRVMVGSIPGRGSTFSICLPAV